MFSPLLRSNPANAANPAKLFPLVFFNPSGAILAPDVYSRGILKPTINPTTAAMMAYLPMKRRLSHNFFANSSRSISSVAESFFTVSSDMTIVI